MLVVLKGPAAGPLCHPHEPAAIFSHEIQVRFARPLLADQPAGLVVVVRVEHGEVVRFWPVFGVSPDQKGLYVGETWTRSVLAFDLTKDGTLSKQRLVHQFSTPTVDGLAVDEHGRIWVARLDNKTVDVLSSAGKVLARYPVGGDRVTNLAWWEKSLYVTVAGKVGAIYRLDVNVRGAP
jgi:sugar lactone lactonase YvrE